MLVMPTLIVFEDTHWIDDASRSVLLHLVRSSAPRPWLVAITRRAPGPALRRRARRRAAGARAPALPGEETARLALAAAGDVALSEELLGEVSERSGGNPLFVRELVAASRADGGVAALPETVETLITTRIDTLEPGDRFLLRNASVLGARVRARPARATCWRTSSRTSAISNAGAGSGSSWPGRGRTSCGSGTTSSARSRTRGFPSAAGARSTGASARC